MREYGLIDGDAHIVEAPKLWQERLPAKYKSRAPHHESFPQGDGWVLEGAKNPIPFGLTTRGGMPGGMKPTDRKVWVRFEEVNPACLEPNLRLKAMDEDGVRAALMYPSPAIANQLFTYNTDREFHIALLQAYNDWLSDFCKTDLKRLGLLALMPTTGVQDALDELRRTRKLPGFRGAVLGRFPGGGMWLENADDAFFAEAEAAGVPVNIHVSLSGGGREAGPPAPPRKGAIGDMRHLDAPLRIKELITTGVFDRFPKLNVVFAETDAGWVPYVKEQMDDRFKRLEPDNKPDIKMKPSEYFDRNLGFTYITDSYAIQNWKRVGAGSLLWSSDFPHSGTDWPRSWKVIEEVFVGVPAAQKRQILAGNAERIYHFDKN